MVYVQAWKLWNEGRALNLVDYSFCGEYSDEALRCIQVGLVCTQEDPSHRPTMSTVLEMLLGEESSLQDKVAEAALHPNNWVWNSSGNYSDRKYSHSAATFEYDNTMER